MLHASLAGLALQPAGVYVDATFGRGGHSRAILEQLGAQGVLHAFDRDPQAVSAAEELAAEDTRLKFHRCCYSEMGARISQPVDGVLFDLGVSSPQLDQAERGFSFSKDGPLDMRMDPTTGEPASAWLARADADEIADVLFNLGDERASRRIGRAIVHARGEQPLQTTAQLAAVIERALGGRRGRKIHPATRSFQAIRIHINQELERVREGLAAAISLLAPGGRLAVISFHSIEDRLVKRYLRDEARSEQPLIKLRGKQFPEADESRDNPRARSAVLRLAERLPSEVAA